MHIVNGLQIDEEDVGFLHKEWRFQRIGWVAMLLLAALAFTGVFGHGPVAHDQVGDPKTFAADFERVARHGSDTELEVMVGPGLQRDSILRIGFNRDYLAAFNVINITPEPDAHGESGNVVYFDFTRADRRSAAVVIFQLKPTKYWHHPAQVSLAGVTTLSFSQFILP